MEGEGSESATEWPPERLNNASRSIKCFSTTYVDVSGRCKHREHAALRSSTMSETSILLNRINNVM